jgi:predicted PurR-regulated permease PerM
MSTQAPSQFWTWQRVLWYTLIIGIVIFAVYKESLALYVLERAMHVIVALLLAVAAAYVLNPVTARLTRGLRWGSERGRRTLAALLTVLAAIAVIVGLIALTAAPIITELRDLGTSLQEWAKTLPSMIDRWMESYTRIMPPGLADTIEQQASALASALLQADYFSAIKAVLTHGWYLVELLLIPVLCFHLLRDGRALRQGMLDYVPHRYREAARVLSDDIHGVLKDYVRGILILCLLFGVTTTLLLYFAHTRIYLTLGILAGLSWAIPIIGPVVAGMFVVGVTLLQSGLHTALIVLAIYVGLNIMDSKLVTPFVLGDAMQLHPVTIITAMLLSGQLLGPVGMLVAVPVTAAGKVIWLRYMDSRDLPRAESKETESATL